MEEHSYRGNTQRRTRRRRVLIDASQLETAITV